MDDFPSEYLRLHCICLLAVVKTVHCGQKSGLFNSHPPSDNSPPLLHDQVLGPDRPYFPSRHLATCHTHSRLQAFQQLPSHRLYKGAQLLLQGILLTGPGREMLEMVAILSDGCHRSVTSVAFGIIHSDGFGISWHIPASCGTSSLPLYLCSCLSCCELRLSMLRLQPDPKISRAACKRQTIARWPILGRGVEVIVPSQFASHTCCAKRRHLERHLLHLRTQEPA